MELTHTCPQCSTENEFVVNLGKVIEYFNSISFDGKIKIDDLTINIRPLKYSEITRFNMENYKLQKMLYQLSTAENAGDDEQMKKIQDDIYKRISEMQIELFLTSIENVQIGNDTVDDPAMIDEWLKNSDREFFKRIKDKLEANKAQWDMPKQDIKCSSCGHESKVEVTLDQSNFFVRG
jgi:C4-type Zn-finger protein